MQTFILQWILLYFVTVLLLSIACSAASFRCHVVFRFLSFQIYGKQNVNSFLRLCIQFLFHFANSTLMHFVFIYKFHHVKKRLLLAPICLSASKKPRASLCECVSCILHSWMHESWIYTSAVYWKLYTLRSRNPAVIRSQPRERVRGMGSMEVAANDKKKERTFSVAVLSRTALHVFDGSMKSRCCHTYTLHTQCDAACSHTHTHTKAGPPCAHCHIENFKLKKLFCAQVKKFRIKNWN